MSRMQNAPKNQGVDMNFNDMNDDEILETILEAFEDDGRLDLDYIDVEVVSGSMTLNGRVSSEEELQIIEELLDQLKFTNYVNNVWVDETLLNSDPDEEEKDLKGIDLGEDDDIEEDYEEDEDEDYDV